MSDTTKNDNKTRMANDLIKQYQARAASSLAPATGSAEMLELKNELSEANSKIQHLLNHCQDAECSVCAEIACKHHEPLHFHHDGCPVCEYPPTPEQIGKAWLANSSLERWFPITAEELEKCKARLKWLHDCSTGQTDPEGYEWGIYRVKWENGKPVDVRQTNSDLRDLDAEIARTSNTEKP